MTKRDDGQRTKCPECRANEAAARAVEQVYGGRAHTYASENADIYRAQDGTIASCAKAIRALRTGCRCETDGRFLSNAELADAIMVAYKIGSPEHFRQLQAEQLRRAAASAEGGDGE